MVKVITGIRRCGKSYLLFEIYHQYLNSVGVDDDHIIALALDDDENIRYRNPLELGQYIRSLIVDTDKMYYCLLYTSREQPMGRRVALMMTFRNYIKSDNRDIQNILNALSLRGMFPKAPKLSDRMSTGLEEKLKLMRLMQYSALTCSLC